MKGTRETKCRVRFGQHRPRKIDQAGKVSVDKVERDAQAFEETDGDETHDSYAFGQVHKASEKQKGHEVSVKEAVAGN